MASTAEDSALAPPPPAVRRERAALSAEVGAAWALADALSARLEHAPEFQRLPVPSRKALLRDLGVIKDALSADAAPTARALDDASQLRGRLLDRGRSAAPERPDESTPTPPGPRRAATETLAQRAGALIDEIDFSSFVAGLVHGTFDAIVDAAIRQMESFADLVSAVAKDVDTFTAENVSTNQARDWLVEKYPRDVDFSPGTAEPRLRARNATPDGEPPSPAWLGDFGLSGEELSDELLEEQLVPLARRRLGESRMQMLATMVLLGLNRVVVRDGSIRARVRFRAAARDKADVEYAVSQDPGGGGSWGARGSNVYGKHTTMVSTVGVNAQTESSLQAELFGEVQINFASETLPLDRFADQARQTLIQRHARASAWQQAGPAPAATGTPALAPAPAAAESPPTPASNGEGTTN